MTTRQVRRLARRCAAAGPVGLLSKRFGRPSNNRTDDGLADAVIKDPKVNVRRFWTNIGYRGSSEPSTGSIWPRRPSGSCRSLRACGSRASMVCRKSSTLDCGAHASAKIDGCESGSDLLMARTATAHRELNSALRAEVVLAERDQRPQALRRQVRRCLSIPRRVHRGTCRRRINPLTYDKLGEIDQGAIVENKRLGHALRISSVIQADRDSRLVQHALVHRV